MADREVNVYLSAEERERTADYRIIGRRMYGTLRPVPQVKERFLWWDLWFDLEDYCLDIADAEKIIRLHMAVTPPKLYKRTKVRGHV